ncbi:mannitol dehydrogenase family protein [Occultella glacieicola]|uniref:mannitol dehydrogenase family protein n=1 Tax=Occultella glacieicola TaxID=2518684 RepID=UPI001A9DB8E3|nr:mannitol dehydrogenase family protein [Occultella glacieicola]
MSATPRLSRSLPDAPAAAPVRIVHLGVGNFHRAHQAWYTHHAPDAGEWGIAAFTGRRPDQAEALGPQDGLYTLIVRGREGDDYELIGSLSAVHAASEQDAYLGYLADPALAIVTMTVTEHGYVRGDGDHLDARRPEVLADVEALREDPRSSVTTMPAKLVAGLLARRAAGAGALTILSCDNLPENGAVTRTLVTELAALVDESLVDWTTANVDFATSMVDRITPATTPEDREHVAAERGYDDASPVPTEPFSEWVVSGTFPAGRPRWEDAGVKIVDDVAPHERRKLWLLNGSHSQLAYVGSVRGHTTIDQAIADPRCLAWVEQFWDEAQANLGLPDEDVSAYRAALLDRYRNERVRHLLAQIANDGSQKLPVRTLPTLNAERAAGRVPVGAATTLAGWVLHLRGVGAPVKDPGAGPAQDAANSGDLAEVVPAVLNTLQAGLGADADLVAAVVAQAATIQE